MSEPDALETLREQIRAATEAAERLVREVGGGAEDGRSGPGSRAAWPAPAPEEPGDRSATAHATTSRTDARSDQGRVPPAGWDASPQGETASELEALAQLLQTLRELLPADLQQQLTEVIRQLLILLRTLIDWAVARIEREAPGRAVEVEDIPIS